MEEGKEMKEGISKGEGGKKTWSCLLSVLCWLMLMNTVPTTLLRGMHKNYYLSRRVSSVYCAWFGKGKVLDNSNWAGVLGKRKALDNSHSGFGKGEKH